MNDISIIITLEEQQAELRRLLPDLLAMRCEGECEVIVVDKKHDKDLEEWLEDMEVNHPQLSHTFCSTTARGIDTHRLALTLGAKAASHEWLVVLPVGTRIDGLSGHLAALTGVGADIVVGVTSPGRGWGWLHSYFFRRQFSLFRPSPHIILCRRHQLLGGWTGRLSKHQVVKLQTAKQ